MSYTLKGGTISEKMKRGLEQAEVVLQLLRKTEERAIEAQATWSEVAGHKYAELVDVHHQSMAEEETRVATVKVILHIVMREFPGLVAKAGEWGQKAMDAGIALPDIPEWLAVQVGPECRLAQEL